MARKKQPIAARNLTNPAAQAATFAQREQPDALMWIGLLALLVAVAMMVMLSLEKLWGMALPGCGAGSPCAQAQASEWGKVPIIGWPISYLGLAYFAAVIPAWWLSGRRAASWLQSLLLVGGAISVVYLIVIFSKNMLCPYCLTAHIANLALCGITLVRGSTSVPLSPRALPVAAGVFIGVTAIVGLTSAITRQIIDRANQGKLDESINEMINKEPHQTTTRPTTTTHSTPTIGPLNPPTTTQQVTTTQSSTDTQNASQQNTNSQHVTIEPPVDQKPFTGRYRRGPEPAPIRIVMFFDFQCRDCQRIEAELETLFATRSDISLSPKHFPMNTPCNPAAPNLHNNACWAARAAEAAGILGGNDGFWRMHAWLFKQKGSFTNDELKAALPELGFDVDKFVSVMQGPQTLANIKADIQEGIDLGLYFTPMIFINGVELRGWNVQNAVTRVVDRLTAAGVPSLTAAADHPPTASQKFVDDWREWPRINMPPPSKNWGRGPANAPIRIVVFGDYQEPNTRDLENELNRLTGGREDVSYVFRYFPFNKDCNPAVPANTFPAACVAARAAEAAGMVGGVAGFQQMHAWLFANQANLSEEFIRDNVHTLGLDIEKFMTAWNSPEAAARIAEDINVARRANVNAIPTIFVNERQIPRWRRDNDNILAKVLAEAATEK